MRHLPTKDYNGITIVLSNGSRFDSKKLISGNAEYFFEKECLQISREHFDIRTSDTFNLGLLDNTKGLLLLGEKAMHTWSNPTYKDYTLNEQRGSPLENQWGLPCIASYLPQDAMDLVNWESKYNEELKEEAQQEGYQSDDEEESVFAVKRKGKTRRSNYRFWLRADTRKLLNRISESRSGLTIPSSNVTYRIAPPSAEIISFLNSVTEKDFLYHDIETTVDGGYNLQCIGLATDTSPIYVIPVFRYNGTLFYSSIYSILQALAGAIERATCVSHNGFAFDTPILSWRYRLPIPRRNYDTLIALHRCFPKVEKSLAHGISLFLWEPYHKDEGIFHPRNSLEDQKHWQYNGKDVAQTRALKWAIDEYAQTIPGLTDSIAQANRCVYPYVLMGLNGISFEEDERQKIMNENDKLMTQYLRMIQIFLDHLGYKGTLLPSSPKQCVNFFHHFMNYSVVGRSKTISKRTGQPLNTPSLDEKNFWKLKLRYPDNFLIDLCVRYRQVKKESGMLKFIPWDFNKPLKEMLV